MCLPGCGLNCKPPYPLPVLMLQSPLTHIRLAGPVESGAAFAGAAKPKSGTETAAAAIRVLVASLPRDGLVMAWRAYARCQSSFAKFAIGFVPGHGIP